MYITLYHRKSDHRSSDGPWMRLKRLTVVLMRKKEYERTLQFEMEEIIIFFFLYVPPWHKNHRFCFY